MSNTRINGNDPDSTLDWFVSQSQKISTVEKIVKEMEAIFKPSNVNHSCSEECDPRPTSKDKVYLCKMGVIHVCCEEFDLSLQREKVRSICSFSPCEIVETKNGSFVCNISGRFLGENFIKTSKEVKDSTTTKTIRKRKITSVEKKAKKQKTQNSESSNWISFSASYKNGGTRWTNFENKRLKDQDESRNQCKRILQHLFYSKKRTEIFNKAQITRQVEVQKVLKKFYAPYYKKNKLPPFPSPSFYIFQFFGENKDVIKRTPALEKNDIFIEWACDVIMVHWTLICLSPFGTDNSVKFDFTGHVLAVLCHMREGGSYVGANHGRQNLIPGSKYVAEYMPPLKDMILYGYQKNQITDGTNNISKSYRSLADQGIPVPFDMLKSWTVIE